MSDNFKDIKKESLPFLVDPHSWKWCFACGRRFLIVGLGVREREGEREEKRTFSVSCICDCWIYKISQNKVISNSFQTPPHGNENACKIICEIDHKNENYKSLEVHVYIVIFFSQRNQIHSWDMRGQKVSLSPRHEFQIELPKGTILEVEIIPEMTEEVIGCGFYLILLIHFLLGLNFQMYNSTTHIYNFLWYGLCWLHSPSNTAQTISCVYTNL